MKLFCIVGALALVGYQRSLEEKRTRTVAFQLDAQLPPDAKKRELMTTLPPTVKLTLEGSTRSLDRMVGNVASVALDLRDGTRDQVRFTARDFDVPPDVKIRSIEPEQLLLEWQDLVTRSVPVQSSVTGNVVEGFEVSELAVEPVDVKLTGPANIVQVTQFVRVAPFDVTGLSEGDYRRLLALDPPPARTSYVGTSSAAVSVQIRRRVVSQVFAEVPVEVLGLPGAKAVPASVTVTVVGPPDVVRGVTRELIVPQASVSESDLKRHGSAMIDLRVELSRASAEIQPPRVKVTW
jgi:YbbR domain-containing protein